MYFSVEAILGYRVSTDTPFVFNLHAQQTAGQIIETETFTVDPPMSVEHWTMPESGNRYVRLIAPSGGFKVAYQATVRSTPRLEDPSQVHQIEAGDLPMSVLTHLYPSRFCQSDLLESLARSTFGDMRPGYQRIVSICNWISDNVEYVSGASDALTSAYDTASQRSGVCRDFAHLGIALTRALGVPARYVSAYALRLNPPDFHAVFEAFLRGPSGPGWYVFDPTRMAAPEGIVRIGVGRDAAEVAFCTQFGEMEFDKPVVRITGPSGAADSTVNAVRTEDA